MTGGAWVLVGFGLGLLAAVWVWLIQPDWIYKKASGNETEGWRRYLRGFIVWGLPLGDSDRHNRGRLGGVGGLRLVPCRLGRWPKGTEPGARGNGIDRRGSGSCSLQTSTM